ncbi:hypothetical protein NIES3585_09550 [Nodularia sp. NIES-3585]|nr:hypothetical protein NIES3585_09550 [Nodularia sp. NIES-3585]
MTQKLMKSDFSELDLLQTMEPKEIADQSMRQTVENSFPRTIELIRLKLYRTHI